MKRLGGLCFVLLVAAACDDDACSDAECGPVGGGSGGGSAEPAGGMGGHGGAFVGGVGGAAGSATGLGGAGGEGGAPTSPTTIRVVDFSGEPGIALNVVTNNPDGTLVDDGITGVDGTVELEVPADGSVSLVYADTYEHLAGTQTERRIETILVAGAPPAEMRFTSFFYPEESDPYETMTQQFIFSPRAGASTYELKTSCFGAYVTPSVYAKPEAPGCTSDGLYDVLLLARDASGAVIDYARADDLVFTAGGASTTGLAWGGESIATIQFELLNIPTAALSASWHSGTIEPQGGMNLSAYFQGAVTDPANQHLAELQHLDQYGTVHCQQGSVSLENSFSASLTIRRTRCGTVPDLSTFQFDVSQLSRYEALLPDGDPLAQTWTESWPGGAGDLVLARTSWIHGEDVGSWTIYSEPVAASVVFPSLPTGLIEFAPAATDVLTQYAVFHIDYADIAGFDQVVAAGQPPDVGAGMTEIGFYRALQ